MSGGGLRETVWLLVCEPRPRWAPALKTCLARRGAAGATLRVVTSPARPFLGELAGVRAPLLLLPEIEEAGLDQSLRWLASVRRAPCVETIALLGDDLGGRQEPLGSLTTGALREAGAVAVLRSTTELPSVVGLALRHAGRTAERLDASASCRDSVWRRLPWQRAPGPLR